MATPSETLREPELASHLKRAIAKSHADRNARVEKHLKAADHHRHSRQAAGDWALNREWRLEQDYHPSSLNKSAIYISNKAYYLLVDSEAWIAVKPDKAHKLCYLVQLIVIQTAM